MSDTKQPRHFYWKQIYEQDGKRHWALCDSEADLALPPARVTCGAMVLLWSETNYADGRPLDKQYFPKLVVKLLTEHYDVDGVRPGEEDVERIWKETKGVDKDGQMWLTPRQARISKRMQEAWAKEQL